MSRAIEELLWFFEATPYTRILEKTETTVVLIQYDYVMVVTERAQYSSDLSIQTYEYEIYIEDNIEIFRKFKKRTIEQNYIPVMKIIRKYHEEQIKKRYKLEQLLLKDSTSILNVANSFNNRGEQINAT